MREKMSQPIHIRVEKQVKEDASRIFESLGLDLSTAIRIFLKKVVQVKGLPFELNEKGTAND